MPVRGCHSPSVFHPIPRPLLRPPMTKRATETTTTMAATDMAIDMDTNIGTTRQLMKIIVAGGLRKLTTNVCVNFYSACHPSLLDLCISTHLTLENRVISLTHAVHQYDSFSNLHFLASLIIIYLLPSLEDGYYGWVNCY